MSRASGPPVRAITIIDDQREPKKKSHRVVDLKPLNGEMIKSIEMINIIGRDQLSLYDQQVWNQLIANAHGPQLAVEDTEFRITKSDLTASHTSNDRLDETILKLMKTVAQYQTSDGRKYRFQLLGGNDMGDEGSERGVLRYSFDKRLVALIQNSTIFGKLEVAVMGAFTSKYALAMYEHFAQKVHMRKWIQDYEIDEFRRLMGVEKGQYPRFGNFKQRVLMPALKEVNALSPFNVSLTYEKKGQRVVKIKAFWVGKKEEDRRRAQKELERSRVGRKTRLDDVNERVIVLEPASFQRERDELEVTVPGNVDVADLDGEAYDDLERRAHDDPDDGLPEGW